MLKFLNVYKTILFWYAILLLVFIPLYPKFPLFNVKGTFVAVRIEDFLILVSVLLWGLYLLLSRRLKDIFKDHLSKAILLFFFIGAVSLFSSIFLTQTVEIKLGVFHYLRRIELMLLLPIFATLIQTKKQFLIIVITLITITLIVNIYALGQQYLDWPVVSTGNSEFAKGLILRLTPDARVNSTFAGHYDLAAFLAMILTLFTALFWGIKKLIIKILFLLLIALSAFVLIITAARVSFLAAVIGMILVAVLLKKKVFIVIFLLISILILIYPSQLRDRMISTITVNFQDSSQRYSAKDSMQAERGKLNIPNLSFQISSDSAEESTLSAGIGSDIVPGEPLDSTKLGVYRSLAIRLNQEWPTALRAFYKNPFLGTGYSSLGIAVDNDILRSLGEIGLLGTLAFSLVIIEISKRIWRLYKQKDGLYKYFSAGALVMILVFIINGLFIDVFEASKVASLFWIIIGINLAVEKLK